MRFSWTLYLQRGVGKVTAKKMNEIGIFYGRDLRKFERGQLIEHFGKTGNHYYKIRQGGFQQFLAKEGYIVFSMDARGMSGDV